MAIDGIGRVWWAGRSLLENLLRMVAFRKSGSRWIAMRNFYFFLDERMALRLYRIMAMTKLC